MRRAGWATELVKSVSKRNCQYHYVISFTSIARACKQAFILGRSGNATLIHPYHFGSSLQAPDFYSGLPLLGSCSRNIEYRISNIEFPFRISKTVRIWDFRISMGGVCAKRSRSDHVQASRLDHAFYAPTRLGWEQAGVFKMGHKADGVVWWGTWRWNGWVA